MINKIKHTPALEPHITDQCEENQVCVSMDGDISNDNYLVLKVDNYYNSLNIGHLGKTPPSIDCLIPLRCADKQFIIYLVELKNIKSPGGFTVEEIYNKFKTTIENFMGKRFKNIFLSPRHQIKKLFLYFVTNPYGETEKRRRQEGSKMDALLARKPFKFRGKRYQIQHKLPNPIIKNC